MSRTFTKLFASITESTVWCEPDRIRLVWICMLAMADARGRVWASIPGLANRARVPIADAEDAINRFLSPDEYSRTPDNEGRRIEPIDGGWRLLNHEKYRSIRDEETIKESKRRHINAKRAEDREKAEKAKGVDNSRPPSTAVDRSRANAEAEADAIKKENCPPTARAPKDSSKMGTRLPDDWQPGADLVAWAKGKRGDIDVAEQVEMFRDYWHSIPGTKGRKVEWGLTFRGWIRRADKPKGARAGNMGPPVLGEF